MVAKQNLSINQGDDYRLAIELKDEFDALMDLTGFEFRGQAKESYLSKNPSFELIFTIRDQVTDTGLVDVLVSSASTSGFLIEKKKDFVYDIEMVQADGDVKRIIEGKISLSPEVTK